MWRAAFFKTWLFLTVVLAACQPSQAADSFLSKSPRPDKNGLPPPLNLDSSYTGIFPSSTADGYNLDDFSSKHLLQPLISAPKADNSDIHLYLQDKLSSASVASIDTVENKCFSRTYVKDTMEQRLGRLEQFVFGKTSAGLNAQIRLEKIAKVVNPRPVAPPPNDETQTVNAESADANSARTKQTPQSLIDAINSGIDHYNLHDYQRAEDDFEKCCAMAPDMARVHSYLAITKLQINERQAALEEFRTTYEIDPFGTYGRYAKLCLLKLAGDEEIRKRGPIDSDEVLQSSLSKINQQSDNLIAFHNNESNRTGYARFGTGLAAQIQATNKRNNTVLQNAYTQESANNLKHLMGVKLRPGDAHLRAWGTTLNTRYYGADTYLYAPYYIPREYPVELKAQQSSLADSLAKHKGASAPTAVKSGKNAKKGQHHA